MAVLGVLTVGLYAYVTSSGFLIARIAPVLESRLGGEVRIDTAGFSRGTIELRGFELHAPGLPGRQGRILRAESVVISLDMGDLWRGRIESVSMHADDVVFRCAESRQNPGTFNFMALQPKPVDRDVESAVSIDVVGMSIEMGVYDASGFDRRGVRVFDGRLRHSADSIEVIEFSLVERSDGASRDVLSQEASRSPQRMPSRDDEIAPSSSLALSGSFNRRTNDYRIEIRDLHLDDRAYAMTPQIVREWWDRIEPEGRVSRVRVETKPTEGQDRGDTVMPTVTVDIDRAALTLPIEAPEQWSRYQAGRLVATEGRPRLHLNSGMAALDDSRFQLIDVIGRLRSTAEDVAMADVPFELSLDVDLPGETRMWFMPGWLDEALETSPFNLVLKIPAMELPENGDVSSREPGRGAIELPTIVARALEMFQVRRGTLETSLRVLRNPPVEVDGVLTASPIQSSGQMRITDGAGAYERFSYPLDDIDALIELENEELRIVKLTGRAGEDADVAIFGELYGDLRHPGVALSVRVSNGLVDETLRYAVPDHLRRVYDALLSQVRYEELAGAGVWPDEDVISSLREELEALEHEQASEEERSEPRRARASDELDRIRRRINAGPFKVGGRLDLDIAIHRSPGEGKPVEISGRVTAREGGVLVYEHFGYPLKVVGGSVDWFEDRIEIVEDNSFGGVAFVTPGGGKGVATGSVSFPRENDQRRIRSDLEFTIENDHITPVLLASIPGEGVRDQHASSAAQSEVSVDGYESDAEFGILHRLDLRGDLDYTGRVFTDPDDDITRWDFDVHLASGTLDATDEFRRILDTTDRTWGIDLAVGNLNADIQIKREKVAFDGKGTRQSGGKAMIAGSIDAATELPGWDRGGPRRGPAVTTLDLGLTELPLEPAVLGMIRGDSTIATKLWEKYQPSGSFALETSVSLLGEDVTIDDVRIGMETVQIAMQGTPVELIGRGGGISIAADPHHARLELNSLALDIRERQPAVGGAESEPANAPAERPDFQGDSPNPESPAINELPRSAPRGGDAQWREGGRLTLDGFIVLPGEGIGDAATDRDAQDREQGDIQFDLVGHWQRCNWQLDALRHVLRQADDRTGIMFDRARPEGRFNAHWRVSRLSIDEAIDYDITLNPLETAFTVGENRLEAHFTGGGSIKIDRDSIQFVQLHGTAPEGESAATFNLQGDLQLGEQYPLNLSVEGRGEKFARYLSPWLPIAARTALDSISFASGDEVGITAGRIEIADLANSDDHTTVTGRITTTAASFSAGVDFADVAGDFDVLAKIRDGRTEKFTLTGEIGRMKAARREMTDVQAEAVLSDDGTSLSVPSFRGDLYGGAVNGEAAIGIGTTETASSQFSVRIDLIGVRLADLLDAGIEEEEERSGTQARGSVYGTLHFSGDRGDPAQRLGRGQVQILDGRLARMPVLLRVLQVAQLTPPLRGSFDYAEASFFIESDQLIFERLKMDSPTIEVTGRGRMNIDTRELDLRLRSRGKVAGLRDLVSLVTDPFFEIEVKGTLDEPRGGLIALPGLSPQSRPNIGRPPVVPESPP